MIKITMLTSRTILVLGVSMICIASVGTGAANATTLHLPGFVEVNQIQLPDGVPSPLGDIMFSDDGTTMFILGGSEGVNSGVWTVPVIRDATGSVTALGAATHLFSFPLMDTSLEIKPGTETLFFRIAGEPSQDVVVGERLPDGTITVFTSPGGELLYGG